ncbi:MAG: hypothetical protein ACPG4Q_06150 [Phycisphaeraceae bacterium]|jgi:hypothetical protein
MRKTSAIIGLSVLLVLGGCSSRPISKTIGHVKKTYNTTKQVYHTTRAVVDLVNPLEYVYVSEGGQALTPDGSPFVTADAVVGKSPEIAE